MILKNRAKQIMIEKQISINKISRDLNIRYATVYNLFNKEDLAMSRLWVVAAVAQYLNVPVNDFFEIMEEEKDDPAV